VEVSVDGDACAACDLLGAEGEAVRAGGGAGFDEDVSVVSEVNEVFAFGGGEDISLRWRRLNRGGALRQYVTDPEAAETEEEGSAFELRRVHGDLLRQ
jgi:hypothetical protein